MAVKLIWIPEKCYGCSRAPGLGCEIYADPIAQHSRIGGCAMDSRRVFTSKPEPKLNPMKASKRQRKGLFNIA